MQSRHVTTEQLSASLDWQLSETDRRAVEAHLEGCASCRRELDELRQTVALLRAVPAASVPLDRSGIGPAERWPSRMAPRPWVQPAWLRAMGGAAAALMVVVLAADAVLPAARFSPAAGTLPPSAAVAPAAQRALKAEPALERAPAPLPTAEVRDSAGDSSGARAVPPFATAPAAAAPPAAPEQRDAEQAARTGRTAAEPFASDREASGPSQEQVPIRPGQAGAVALGLLAALLLTASLLVPRLRPRG